MNDKDLDSSWAWSQIEAMADGSLRGRERRRMRLHVRADARLRRAVEEARAVSAALRGVPRAPLPHGLLLKLIRIPSLALPRQSAADEPLGAIARPRASFMARPAGLAAAAIAATAIVAAFLLLPRPVPQPNDGSSPPSGGQHGGLDSQARATTESARSTPEPESGASTASPPADQSDASIESLRELDAALQYVRSGAEITRRGVARQVGRGFIEALNISRSALVDDDSQHKKGG
ncbi:MAG TPA: hypothetical protein VFY39_04815 [Gammaproteobacteria bacterium]|nr:hypothetical protein [Gammaproteobacteria bacterium]